MNIEQIQESLKHVLSESRYQHSLGVMEVAHDLAVIYSCDVDQAIYAGILHDCAKYVSNESLLQECELRQIQVTEVERKCPFLLHAKVGAIYAQQKYGVEEEQIMNAIIYHTTGRPNMTLLEKIIFTADYIEPFRKPLPRIEELRKTAYQDLDYAVFIILDNMLKYLTKSGNVVDYTTVQAYDYYKEMLNL